MDHVLTNRRCWDEKLANWFGEYAREHWAADEPYWGTWSIPQSELPVLPTDVAGLVAVELGCGTGYVPAWLARRGARPVGVDNSAQQLATARACRASSGCGSRWCTRTPAATRRPAGLHRRLGAAHALPARAWFARRI